MRAIALLFLATLLAAAQTNPGPIRLEGTVVSATGEPIPTANVRLQGRRGLPQNGQATKSYSASTDAAGKFVFEDVAPGAYDVSAEKAGFLTQNYGARASATAGTLLNVTEGQRLAKLDIKMTPQGVITGRITDQNGAAAVNAQVLLFRSTYLRGRKQLQQQTSVETNDRGEYRIASLTAGRYVVSAGGGDRPAASTTEEVHVNTFYPNGLGQAGATSLDVKAGVELRGIDIQLRRARVYSVRGKVLHPAGPVPQGIVFELVPKDEVVTTPNRIGLRPDGAFEYHNLLPGTYVLQTAANAPARFPRGRLEVTIADSDLDNLIVPLLPGVNINGTVRMEGGDLPAGTRLNVTLSDTEGSSNFIGWISPVQDDSTFKIENAKASKYAATMSGLPEGTYMKSVRFGGQDVTRKAIDITNSVTGTLDVVLSDRAADLSGSVTNDKGDPLTGVTVTLWPKNMSLVDAAFPFAITTTTAAPRTVVRGTTTDQNGKFRLIGLAPGDYYVAAWEELDLGLANHPDFLARFIGEASAITLAESTSASQNLKLIPNEKIRAEIAKLP